jgi:DNA-binding response OmpR family regulator
MNVLIIEPDGILAKVYQKAMLNTGKNAYIAQTAQKAISMIDELKPSVIILELQLSGHSGIEFLHEFRSYEDWTNIRVIIHSSIPKTSLNLDSRIWKQLGIDKYLYKATTSLDRLVNSVSLIHYENS